MTYSREVRVGLVLYGGVSLAVYENGVAQEFYRAIRGEGIYSLLKDVIDSDVVVDVISGTSAGGVNGVLLAYSIANDLDFTSVARLWRDDGDIADLIRDRRDPETTSILNSEGYYEPKLLASLKNLQKWTPGPDSSPSEVAELDLFATGTDISGQVRTVFDDGGHAIDVKDHRAVFHLEYRQARKNDFDANAVPELARLARLTSCFPVAFAPVAVSPGTHVNLAKWGDLSDEAVFLDGGILDNKPFSYAIDAIFRRKADRDVQRLLFYVEPNPERFMAGGKPTIPGPVSAAVSALVGIPGYESIASDLESVARHNEVIARVSALTEQVAKVVEGGTTLEQSLSTLAGTSQQRAVYVASRLMQLRNRVVEGILNDGQERAFFRQPRERRSARILVDSFSQWDGSGEQTLEQFDVYFRIRRLYNLTYKLKAFLHDEAAPPPRVAEHGQALWRAVNHYLHLFEVVQSQMEVLADGMAIDWKSLDDQFRRGGNEVEPNKAELEEVSARLWGQVYAGMEALLTADSVTDALIDEVTQEAAFSAALISRCRLAVAGGCPAGRSGNLLARIDRAVIARLAAFATEVPENSLVAHYAGFAEVDQQIFPLQYAAGTDTRDILQVVRLSPVDAQRALSGRPLEEKICGRTLGAFGGFFKKPWRANDIMWGRVDALCQVIECLFTKERVRKLGARLDESALQTRLAAMFQASTPETVKFLAQQLAAAPALSDSDFDALTTALVEAGQREIVSTEWREVIDGALEQERDWGHHHVLTTPTPGPVFSAEHLTWKPIKRNLDGLIVALASQAAAAPQVHLFDKYRVAGRRFTDEIPKPVLLELATLALLRLERSVLAELPKARKLRLRVLHGALFGWVLPAVYGWARFSRTAPEYGVALTAAIFVAGILGVLLGGALLTIGITQTIARSLFWASFVALLTLMLVVRRR